MDGRRARIVLGVTGDAGPAEIRRAFRARALVTHPDHGGDRSAFVELADAFDSLVDAHPVVEALRPPAALPTARPRFPRRPAPKRAFADVLQAATARLA
jgi:curved DNA-binding protein CbpA